MVTHIRTVAFQGVDVLPIDVQVQMAPGMPVFTIVGLPDKAVAESRERVRAALGRWDSRCRSSASSSTWHRPTC